VNRTLQEEDTYLNKASAFLLLFGRKEKSQTKVVILGKLSFRAIMLDE
jgi:hypothetical protein